MTSIQKVIKQTKEDITILREAFEFVTDEKFRIVNKTFTREYIGLLTLKYSMWAFHSYNEDEYLEFLKKLTTGEIESEDVIFEEFRPMVENVNLKSTEILDRLDYSLKFLGENFDIPLPQKLMPKYRNQKISVTNESYQLEKLIEELELFITRVHLLQNNIDSFKENKGKESIDEYKNVWIEKLTQNQFNELLSELIKYFGVEKNEEKFIQVVQLKQRYTKLKRDEQLGTKNGDEMNIELNKITKTILEIIK